MRFTVVFLFMLSALVACSDSQESSPAPLTLSSPNGALTFELSSDEYGRVHYRVVVKASLSLPTVVSGLPSPTPINSPMD